ncbi:serine protease [Variovorax sp. dw_308]|uniref:serine protease n=1 Tax=Variovorax sp. dw_308 TaxID=2721546 RepID=UPI001C47E2A0|nr:serine protease [Variovorax sp. dw_308]
MSAKALCILVAAELLNLAAGATEPPHPPTMGAQFSLEQLKSLGGQLQNGKLSAFSKPPASRAIALAEKSASIQIDPRIIGGDFTTIDKNPWQVALVVGFAPEPIRQEFCGGSIVAPNWIVTAAHCVDNSTTPDRVDVIAGTSFYKYKGERIKVAKVLVHKDWNPATMANDIALLKLWVPTTLGQPIALPASEAGIPPGSNIEVSGWGAALEGGTPSEVLMAAQIPMVDNGSCNAPDAYDGRITNSMFCAGLRGGGLDSCQGDSGGPASLMLDGIPTLVGIVSWGEGCARQLKFGVYTRVSVFKPWVDSTIAGN